TNTYPTGYAGSRFNVGTHAGATGNGNGNNIKGTFQSVRHIAQDFRIHSNQSGNYTQISVEYFVVQGCSLAVYRMPCRINGNIGYHLTVWLTDKDRVPAEGNRVRVRVMQDSPSSLIYDTEPGVLDNVLPGTMLSQGTVKITPAGNSGCTVREIEELLGITDVLLQNIPNPFNNTTQISFMIPEGGYATLKVYNYLGQEVKALYAGETEAGNTYKVTFDGSELQDGVYFYTLTGTGVSETRKMVIQK
ncbi:MAG: T9SS type A sorting domain-containing protein, partial [Bacteroidia bacterium]|nr:T9SS type A sorting domain-containing protein [Bacteroidia bacterium]